MTLDAYLSDVRERIDSQLEALLPPVDVPPESVHGAMRHSVFAGGKRIRPALALASADACGGADGIEVAACALECIHTYSLIHDDLPALDDDDMRRGKPSCHKAFGEAIAILTGDGLLTAAFRILAELPVPVETRVALVAELSTAAGTVDGMIGGQVADIEAEGSVPTAATVERIHRGKTVALIRAAVRFGGIVAGADESARSALSTYGDHVGLAFQIVDDILDEVSTAEELGKTAGKDLQQGKATYPAVHGIEKSRWLARAHRSAAVEAIDGFGEEAWTLRDLADRIVARTN